jgi:hypothetical protein
MPKKIYNKNAREKALLEEAYSSVYNEGQFWGRDDLVQKGKEEDKARGAVRLQSPSGTSRSTLPKGDPKIKELKKRGYTEIPIEDAEDTDVADQAEFAKIDPLEDEKARLQGFNPRENEEGELSDDWMKQDYEGRQEERGGDHAKGVKMAIEALGMFKDELHIDGHSEDINVNELADAHDQLSRALHWILDETDVEYITGGRATQKAEADSQPEQFTPMEFPHDEY